jgi:hypothetical protein
VRAKLPNNVHTFLPVVFVFSVFLSGNVQTFSSVERETWSSTVFTKINVSVQPGWRTRYTYGLRAGRSRVSEFESWWRQEL